MSEATSVSNKRRTRHDDSENFDTSHDVAEARKRRAFLQTMGQQLREFGNEGTSPQNHSRTSFGPSPGGAGRPTSRAAELGATQTSTQHINTPESDAAPGEDDQLPAGAAKSASRWLWKPNEVLPQTPGARVFCVSFEDLLDWSQSYFDHWHPAFPFLHAPSLLDHFRQIAQTGSATLPADASAAFTHVIVRSIMSMSTVDRRQMNSHVKALPPTLVFHSFNDAINSIQLTLTEESSILSLQALVSVQLFLLSMHRYNAASRLEGLAVRLAFQLGLHRCPMQIPSIPSKEAELRKRLFWSIFCIDRYICIRLGNPLGIRSDDMDVCYPHAERHVDIAVDDTGNDKRLDLLGFLANHANVRGSIMEKRTRSTLTGALNELDHMMEAEAEHTKWWNVVDEYLSDEEQTQSINKAHQITLIVLRFESVLALHRSVLATSKKNSTYNAALQRCISASRSIINTLHKALKGFGAFDGSPGQRGYEATPLLWPSFTWAIWMSAFIIISAAMEGQVSREVAIKQSQRSISLLEHLALRGTSWPEACVVAIQNLTTRLTTAPSSTRVSRRTSEMRGQDPSAGALHTDGAQRHQRPQDTSEPRATGQERPWSQPHTQGNTNMAIQRFPSNSSFQPGYLAHSTGNVNLDAFSIPNSASANVPFFEPNTLASAHFAGSGTFLGIAHQTSDNPIPNDEIMHLFNGEDMGYWLGGNQEFGSSS